MTGDDLAEKVAAGVLDATCADRGRGVSECCEACRDGRHADCPIFTCHCLHETEGKR